jgi:two-component system, LytTR family, response regulator LytT
VTALDATPCPTLRALVLEDEWPARNYLVELLEGSGLAEVVGAVATVEEARDALSNSRDALAIDVVFADIRLTGGNDQEGLEFVRSAVTLPSAPMWVLATAFPDHALDVYEIGVVDYLLKPFSEERVEQCLNRLLERRPAPRQPTPLRIVARRGRSLVFVEPKEVWAFEAADRLTSVHTAHGKFDIDLSLTAIEASFGRAFTRVHRNWLVRAEHIRELGRDGPETTLFVGVSIGEQGRGVRVPVARERAQLVRDMLLSNTAGLRR